MWKQPSSATTSPSASPPWLKLVRRLHLNVTPEFERDLRRFMKLRGISRKSDAIRAALHEALTLAGEYDYRTWLGICLKPPLNPKPRFRTEDQLWS